MTTFNINPFQRYDYVQTGNPAVDTNPVAPYPCWLNTTTGEEFVCIDKTTGANIWEGSLGTTITAAPQPITVVGFQSFYTNGSNQSVTFTPTTIFNLLPGDLMVVNFSHAYNTSGNLGMVVTDYTKIYELWVNSGSYDVEQLTCYKWNETAVGVAPPFTVPAGTRSTGIPGTASMTVLRGVANYETLGDPLGQLGVNPTISSGTGTNSNNPPQCISYEEGSLGFWFGTLTQYYIGTGPWTDNGSIATWHEHNAIRTSAGCTAAFTAYQSMGLNETVDPSAYTWNSGTGGAGCVGVVFSPAG